MSGTAPTAVSLFCGAGGDSYGLHKAGYEIIAGVDKNESAIETHSKNLPGDHIVHDLSDVDVSILPDTAKGADVVFGGFPCQPYSPARNDGNGGTDDEKHHLGESFVNWVRELAPTVAVFENVPALRYRHGEYHDHLIGLLSDFGYKSEYRVLNAADYGVPQTRERLITIALRKDVSPDFDVFPVQTHAEQPKMMINGESASEYVSTREAFSSLPIPDDHRHKGGGATSPNPWRDASEPMHTVTATGNNVVEYDDTTRTITVEESKAVQTFPETFEFPEMVGKARVQIGNAVPPRLAESIGAQLKRSIPQFRTAEVAK